MPQPLPATATVLDNWIGDFDFNSIDGFPETSKRQLAPETRPGTDGHILWDTGVRGVPVQVITHRDVAGINDGATAYLNYTAAIGERLNVMYSGGVFPHPFDVLDVKMVKIKATALGVGGRRGGSHAYLVCQWTLLALPPVA